MDNSTKISQSSSSKLMNTKLMNVCDSVQENASHQSNSYTPEVHTHFAAGTKCRKKIKHRTNKTEQKILIPLSGNMNDKFSQQSEDVVLQMQLNDAYGCGSGNSFFNDRKSNSVTLQLNQAYGVCTSTLENRVNSYDVDVLM